jgi:acetyltransferase
MRDRGLGFSHFVSCGNQIGTTVEDYIEYFAADPDVKVVAAIVEDLKNPSKLARVAAAAHAQQKSLVFVQVGRSTAGQVMIRSHTGALAGNAEVMAAFLRRCGIVQADSYDEFVETIALFAHAPLGRAVGNDVVMVSGSGGGAALAADHLDGTGLKLAELHPSTRDRIKSTLPEFGNVTNPIDATGAVFYDPTIMTKLLDAVVGDPGGLIIATAVNAAPAPHDRMRKIATAIADMARSSGRTIVAYQVSPLGPVDGELVASLHAAGVPFLMGIASSMGALRHLPSRQAFAARARTATADDAGLSARSTGHDFLSMRQALVESGVPVVDAALASSADAAIAAFRRFDRPVALKAEADGLLHKSDLGCVRLGCATEAEVAEAYRTIFAKAQKAGFRGTDVLVQPMVAGIAEAYAGIIDDPLYGPAIVFGLGGIFVEILKDTTIEMAPLSNDDALAMIHRLKAAPLLLGERGRPRGDIAALAALLVRLSHFATANTGTFRALDLNPIIVRADGEGVAAVDIAVDMGDIPATEGHR